MPEIENSELPEDACWDLLEGHRFGRLAYHLMGEVSIVPLNYGTDRDTKRLVFRTQEGSKLLGVVMHSEVAFEIDDVKHGSAWSVVVRGRGRVLEGKESRAAENLDITPWVGGDRYLLVAIDVTEVTGRHYPLQGRG